MRPNRLIVIMQLHKVFINIRSFDKRKNVGENGLVIFGLCTNKE